MVRYKDGSRHAKTVDLPSGKTIRILNLPFFIATKMEAFNSRGKLDLENATDLEDIILLIDSTDELNEEIENAPSNLASFLRQEFFKLLKDKSFPDFVDNCLDGSMKEQRFKRIMQRIETIASERKK